MYRKHIDITLGVRKILPKVELKKYSNRNYQQQQQQHYLKELQQIFTVFPVNAILHLFSIIDIFFHTCEHCYDLDIGLAKKSGSGTPEKSPKI